MSVPATPRMSGPFAHERSSVRRTMGLVMLALAPATAYNLYLFGWPAIDLFVVTVLACLAVEAACLGLARRPVLRYVTDGSAVLTGWLLAASLPPWAPWWIGVVGAVVAIVVGKQVFGGIGQNVFNPAMVARVALLISFPLEMTSYVAPTPLGSVSAPGFLESLAIFAGHGGERFDAVSSASILGFVKTELGRGVPLSEIAYRYEMKDLMVGAAPGSLGETSALLLLLGGLFLIFMRVITWHIPAAMLGAIALLSGLFHLIDPQHYVGPAIHLMSGATLLGAFFIATDLVTSPVTLRGQLVFGAGCGILVFVIRTWAGYPEGVAFAVLLMNACTPLIDRYMRPRIYGRTPSGDPLKTKGGAR